MSFLNEKQVELKLVTETRKKGGLAVKFVSPSFSGMPDRLVLLPGGKLAFVEVKAPGKKPRVLQVKRHEKASGAGVPGVRPGCPGRYPRAAADHRGRR
jgi:hypothetical protein